MQYEQCGPDTAPEPQVKRAQIELGRAVTSLSDRFELLESRLAEVSQQLGPENYVGEGIPPTGVPVVDRIDAETQRIEQIERRVNAALARLEV